MLTELQNRFCQEYIEDFDPDAAIVRAGYQFRSDAEKQKLIGNLLGNVKVQHRIASLLLDRAPLTNRGKNACLFFLRDGNTQSAAYRRAGYAGNPRAIAANASRFFARPATRQYLRDLQVKLQLESEIDYSWVLRHAKEWVESGTVALTDVADFSRDGGMTLKDLNQLPRHMRLAIQQISRSQRITEDGDIETEFQIKLHRRDTTSLALIARHIGFGSDWNAMLRTAEKYGYEMRPTATGYELIQVAELPDDAELLDDDEDQEDADQS